jgi:hypothetical protein
LIPHKETRPVASGLLNMFDSGALLITIMCRSFRAVVNMLYVSF